MALALLNEAGSEMDIAVDGKMLASGQSREIYALPCEYDLLLKIQKQQPPPRRFFRKFAMLRALRGVYKRVVPLRREVREYRRVANEGAGTGRHLQDFRSLVHTDMGVGLVVRAIRQRDGALALTLQQIIDTGRYDARIHAAFVEFLQWFVASKIVAADIHLSNIVLNEENDALVLIDGIGDKTFLPVRAWLPALNARYKARVAQALLSQVALRFMEASLKRPFLVLAIMVVGTAFGIDISDGQLIDG